MSTESSVVGFPPAVSVGTGNPEALKYGKLWATPEYRIHAPGEDLAAGFLHLAQPPRGSHVIDFGCGTGRGALKLAAAGLKVTMVDFVRNCLDPAVEAKLAEPDSPLRFVKHDLESPLLLAAPYGYCTDVMEHMRPARVDDVLDHILLAAEHVFFSIATEEDEYGKLIGEPLHLCIRPYEWWLDQFARHNVTVHWSDRQATGVGFYVSAWKPSQTVVDMLQLNTEEQQVRTNVAINITKGWRQVVPHPETDLEVVILGGGPSLAAHEAEIKAHQAAGAKVVGLNNAARWALERDIAPVTQIMVDARPFNARFTHPVDDRIHKYLLASQCDPSVFEGLPPERTFLWHTTADFIRDLLTAQYAKFWPIPGGSTVLLRAIPLLRMLGYKRFHLYGCDSCVSGTMAHHAYAQPENADEPVLPVSVTGGRMFWCTTWQLSQAHEFMDLVKYLGDQIELAIYGDGLLAHLLTTGASFAPADDAEEG